MLRRIHVPALRVGTLPLAAAQARHARDVLRLADRTAVEVFDDAGLIAGGTLRHEGSAGASVVVESISSGQVGAPRLRWSVAAAVPKGERADWMVEKLSELGADEFVPLAAARSVVLPEGRNKLERWSRIATESAKQSRRSGVMRVAPLTGVSDAVSAVTASAGRAGWYLSTAAGATPVRLLPPLGSETQHLTAFIGPEGGWTDAELSAFAAAAPGRFTPVGLTPTVLRVETAAVAAAAVIATMIALPPTA